MPIRLIITGGTVGKKYHELTGELDFNESHIDEMLRQGRHSAPIEITPLLLKDSLEMTAADRDKVASACLTAAEERIVITHGTDTMVETAQLLAKTPHLADKTIVLTGAMIPYSFGVTSDGLFNLGSAIAFAQTLTPGVYVAMNGQYFTSDNVRKDRAHGTFVALKNPTEA
ncbi:MAG TPA: asparaginase domain-containing protein [Candidatus Saccharimonadales bacterium]|jgi:L-asparaginase|nr:asparaginase domain-containing protein [Candidatus Saccharimonadales bacterium]